MIRYGVSIWAAICTLVIGYLIAKGEYVATFVAVCYCAVVLIMRWRLSRLLEKRRD